MARIFSIFVSFCIAAGVWAAPLHRRQTGDLQCNLARLRIISDISGAETLIGQLNTTELSTATAVAVAQAGLKSVDSAIQDILTAVFAGQTAPANSRAQVDAGVNTTLNALAMITDPSANATVTEVLSKLASAATDGNDVVTECK
ncbi:hypothetical protein B0H17DRAFT_1007088 [Mycena rosella]|uniref:Cell wall galactomannoprotein n=1 Tax=Mycena rosella TaxID=1033263 RepID=A0AAD7DQY4_MYCRO|nr:hypothetical protein B0H17DRAFT_1007088 [Mycena rosella]